MKKYCLFLISLLLLNVSFAQVKSKFEKDKEKYKKLQEEKNKQNSSTASGASTTLGNPSMKVQMGHTGYIDIFKVHPEGKKLVTFSRADHLCKVWDIETGRELYTMPKDTDDYQFMKFSKDGNYFYYKLSMSNPILKILDFKTRKLVAVIDQFGYMDEDKVEIIPNSSRIIMQTKNPLDNNKIIIYDFKSKQTITLTNPIEGEQAPIHLYAISKDCKYVYIQSGNATTIFTTDGKVVFHKKYSTSWSRTWKNNSISLPNLTADNKYYFYKNFDKDSIFQLDLNSMKIVRSFYKDEFEQIQSSPDGQVFYTYTPSNQTTTFYKSDLKTKIATCGQLYFANSELLFSLDNERVISDGGYSRSVLFATKEANKINYSRGYHFQPVPNSNYVIGRLPDSTNRYSNTLALFDIASGHPIREFRGYAEKAHFSRFTADGRYALWLEDSTKLVAWDLFSGNRFTYFEGHKDDITTIAFSADGKILATGSLDKTVRLFEFETGKLIRSFPSYTKWLTNIAFSPDNQHLAMQAEDMTFKVCDYISGKEYKKCKGHTDRVSVMQFSPDGKFVFSGAWDKTVRMWDFKQSIEVKQFAGFDHPVQSICLSKDGTLLVAGGGEKKYGTFVFNASNKVIVWDVASKQVKQKLNGPQNGSIIQMFLTDDKQYLITRADFMNRAQTWEVPELHSKTTQQISLIKISENKSIKEFVGNYHNLHNLFDQPTNSFIYPDENNIFRELNLTNNTIVRSFSGHTSHPLNLAATKDGAYILTRSNEDGLIHLFDRKTGKVILKYVILGGKNNSYIVFGPDNYYTGSKGSGRALHFVLQEKVYEFDQFDLQFNRPDKVFSKLNSVPKELISSFEKAYQKRLKKSGFTEDMFNGELHLPLVKLDRKNIPVNTNAASLTLKVQADDSKFLLDRINVWVNDVPVFGSGGIDLKLKKVATYAQDITIPLLNGWNKIRVQTMNEKGVSSLMESMDILCQKPIAKPNLYLVTIGVSKFKQENMNLKYASKDATDIAALYKSNTNYASVQQISLLDQQATKASIVAIKSKLMSSKTDDVVIMMVSSHGLLDENLDYYIATYDVNFSKPSENGLAYEELEKLLDGIPARRKLLFMDACHSGEVDKEEVQLTTATQTETGDISFRSFPGTGVKKIGLENSFEMMKEMFSDLRKGSGSTIISSAGGAEYAMEGSQWNNGVFTYSLINGLQNKTADLNKDGKIVLSELQEYLQKQVVNLTQGKQKPTSRAENILMDWPVW